MRRALTTAVIATAATTVLGTGPSPSEASCAAAVVVDGSLLFGVGRIVERHLPALGERRGAVEPACNDAESDEADRQVTVRTLDGLPPRAAVIGTDGLYLARGSLVVSSAHPLHRAVVRAGSEPDVRRRRCRRESGPRRGVLAETAFREGRTMRLRLTTPQGPVTVRADELTRLTNRPAYEPLAKGQRVSVQVSACGGGRRADRIAFVGPTIDDERVETDSGGGAPDDIDLGWFFAAGFVAVLAALFFAARRLR